jgi:hypothetical protein
MRAKSGAHETKLEYKMKIKYQPSGINNFHNSASINLRISGAVDGNTGLYKISARQAAKLANHFCGITDCRCPGGAVQQLDPDGLSYGINPRACA